MQDLKEKVLHVLRDWESKNPFIEKDEFCGSLVMHEINLNTSYDCEVFYHEIERSVFRKRVPFKGKEDFEPSEVTLAEVKEVPFETPKRGVTDWTHDTPIEKTKKTESCEKCEGDGKLNCGSCKGHGKWRCSKCNGDGQVVCPKCKGGRIMKCNGIWGLKGCHGGWVRDGRKEKPCTVCGGTGNIICKKCDVLGRVKCESCSGTGTIRCTTCSGSGEIICKDCEGSGRQLSYVNIADRFLLKKQEYFHLAKKIVPFPNFQEIKWKRDPLFEVEHAKYDDLWKEVKRHSPDILFDSFENQIPKMDLKEEKQSDNIYGSRHIAHYLVKVQKVENIVSEIEFTGQRIMFCTQKEASSDLLVFSQDPAKMIAGSLIDRISIYLKQNDFSKGWNVFFRAFKLDKENKTLRDLKKKFRWFIYKPYLLTALIGVALTSIFSAFSYAKANHASYLEGFLGSLFAISILLLPFTFVYVLLFGYRFKNSLKPVYWHASIWAVLLLLCVGTLFVDNDASSKGSDLVQLNTPQTHNSPAAPVDHIDKTPPTFPDDLPNGYKRVFIESPVGYINMRSGPTTNDPIITQLPNDEVIYVEDKDTLWLKAFRPQDKTEGWVNKGRLGEFAFPFSRGR